MNKANKIWNEALENMRKVLNEETFTTWFKPIIALEVTDTELKLGVSDVFFVSWLDDNFSDMIANSVASCAGKKLKIVFEEGHRLKEELSSEPEINQKSLKKEVKAKKTANCHFKHTFENFIVGSENEFAFAAAQGITSSNGHHSANPLFIYGGTGLGKTHLMQAIAHKVTQEHPDYIVEYISCEHFLNLFIESIKNNKPSTFRNRFRKVDFLLIDDIHFIAGKPQLQEEFFNTFNKLYNEDKKILLTSDRRPSEIGGLEERLVSRFDSGLTVDIQAPGVETRLAILKKKQEEHLIKLDDEILLFVATKIASNVRRLEGAMTRLLTYASLKGGSLSIEMAEKILQPMLEEEVISDVTIEAIQKKVAEYFDLKVADLTGSKRPRNIAVPRMMAMYFCRKLTDKSLPEIGRSFDRNHATVLHAVREIKKRNENDENVKYTLSMLERQLQNT